MDADLFTKGAMAAHDGEKSTGNKIFCIVVMCSGFAFVRSGPRSPACPPRLRDLRISFESQHSRERLNRDLVDETPSPVFARLKRSHNRVLGFSEVLRSVFVLRGIAAAHVTTDLAEAQMNPRITYLQTLLTSVAVR